MDTFCEQLVKIKKGPRFYFGTIGVWFAVAVLAFFSMIIPSIRFFAPIITIAAGYGAYTVSMFFSIEYEYIITNGSFDIDIIYSKRSRKRLATFDLSCVESIEKYNGMPIDKNRYKNVIIACNKGCSDAYKLVFSNDTTVSVAVIVPNERTRQEIIRFVPKYVGNTAFK